MARSRCAPSPARQAEGRVWPGSAQRIIVWRRSVVGKTMTHGRGGCFLIPVNRPSYPPAQPIHATELRMPWRLGWGWLPHPWASSSCLYCPLAEQDVVTLFPYCYATLHLQAMKGPARPHTARSPWPSLTRVLPGNKPPAGVYVGRRKAW